MARVRVLVREPRLEPSAPSRVLDVDVDVDVRTDETFRSITSVSMESRALDPPSRADADAVVPRAWIPPPARRRDAARLNALSLGPPLARDVARVAHAAFGIAHAIVLALARVATDVFYAYRRARVRDRASGACSSVPSIRRAAVARAPPSRARVAPVPRRARRRAFAARARSIDHSRAPRRDAVRARAPRRGRSVGRRAIAGAPMMAIQSARMRGATRYQPANVHIT